METHLTPVGNSKGVRLPKALLAQCGITDRIKLTVTPDGLLVSPVAAPREGWEQALEASPCAETAEEFAAFGSLSTTFDETEWTWK